MFLCNMLRYSHDTLACTNGYWQIVKGKPDRMVTGKQTEERTKNLAALAAEDTSLACKKNA